MSDSVNEHDLPTAREDPSDKVIDDAPEDLDELADEMSIESFPSSDPPSTWAGPDRH